MSTVPATQRSRLRKRAMKSNVVVRVRMLSGIFILIAALIVVRLYFVQIVHGSEYSRQAMGQYVHEAPDTVRRHDIFFTQKDGTLVAAAVMQSGWRVALKPADVTNPETAFAALNAIVPIDRARFDQSVAKKDDPYEEIAFRVSDADASRIRAAKIPGVILAQDEWRTYPAGPLAAHVIGFVGYRGNEKTGVYGLERAWQDTLVEEISGTAVNPFAEIFTNVRSALVSPAAGSGSVVTTIEPSVQRQLEETLEGVMKTYTPKFTGGIIMNPRTGEVYAMAERPGFDPNTYNTASVAVFGNHLVEGTYEMGSIMKPLTMAAGLDTGSIKPSTTYNDTGCIERSGKKICNFDGKARGVVPVQEVLSQSLNVGATYVADTMGHSIFGNYVHAYKLGEKTGIDLPSEGKGNIHSIDNGYDVDYASASFGQGIAVTAVEMTRALSALANEGVLPNPHVVKAIKLESGISRDIPIAPGVRALKPESAEEVTRMLVKVVDEALLHGEIKQEHYSIAAKTGTAQIGIPGGGGYYADRYLHSFFGYFPAHDPKFIVFLFAVEPHGVQYASASLAHPFADIAKYLINYYDVPPDR